MCKTVELTCLTITNGLLLVVIALNIATLVEVNDSDQIDWALQYIDAQISSGAIAEYYDLSHYPKPDEIFVSPSQGDCCDGLCAGSICFIGPLYLAEDTHCNHCCFRLLEPDSCVSDVCKCYANSQV